MNELRSRINLGFWRLFRLAAPIVLVTYGIFMCWFFVWCFIGMVNTISKYYELSYIWECLGGIVVLFLVTCYTLGGRNERQL